MGRKSCYERMDACYEDAFRKISEDRSSRDPASYFINLEMIQKTKQVSQGSERLFYVMEDGSLVQRTDEFQ